ncbi:MAG TPA: hypothetical protein DCK79_08710 [Candidatus Atribacteria bacterium]|nr:hypothetical protein [Candidatus Atribacteria bacterium]
MTRPLQIEFKGVVYIALLYKIRGLSVFTGKNTKALKRRKYKGFCVFLLYKMLVVVEKIRKKEAKICIFRLLKVLQNKGFREILP